MTAYEDRHGLQVASTLVELVEAEILPNTSLSPHAFWAGYSNILQDIVPLNKALLQRRDDLQRRIDEWHLTRRGQPIDKQAYRAFLESIGYIVPEGAPFVIDSGVVDPEIATIAGPQLVVPVSNARFALNAANARWGSLYDALYGTDALPPSAAISGTGYDAVRGAAVVERAAVFLDQAIPLLGGSHAQVRSYQVDGGFEAILTDGSRTKLVQQDAYIGSATRNGSDVLLFKHNGLHLEIVIDRNTQVGATSPAGVADVILEAAVTTIQDLEDSVAAVDAIDKVQVYRNWLGLMRGDLSETFTKNGRAITRELSPDKRYLRADGEEVVLPGRSLLLVRNVGHLMTTDAVLTSDAQETPEGIMDAMITVACALHDLGRTEGPRNSRVGNVYIVKPKMHGPDEVAFTNTLFDRVEDVLGLARHTVKVGIMDEERRTSVNLRECIRAVQNRLVFINTGFLDRTGDEIHTSMQAGPVRPKGSIKDTAWLGAYEDNNVDQGLRSGLVGRAQIGKGMWARPDDMAAMLAAKSAHPRAGASTAWVPSPTAATLHALHYHEVDVRAVQFQVKDRAPASIEKLLTPPLLEGQNLSEDDVSRELDNNAQSILGYVVRWIDQGVGCSKVPDIDNVALMEDRATLRISSQHIANWLLHGVISQEQVRNAFERMARVVNGQNADDPHYRSLTSETDNLAFTAALELVLKGAVSPNGYTEPVLHHYRRLAKAQAA